MSNWPNFFIVGASRSGTTSLYEYLKKNPEIFLSPIKEPNYFSPSLDPNLLIMKPIKDKEKYLSLFKNVKEETVVGEASANYLWDPKAPQLISNVVPLAKIIIILRDPIERAFSHYLMHLSNGTETRSFRIVIKDAIKPTSNDYIRRIVEAGFYSKQLQRYKKYFKADQMKILIFEEFIQDTEKHVKEVMEFLNVNEHIPKNIRIKYNQYSIPRGEISSNVLRSEMVKQLGQKILSQSMGTFLVKKVLNKKVDKPEMSEQDRRFLEGLYRSDSLELQKILNKGIPWNFISN